MKVLKNLPKTGPKQSNHKRRLEEEILITRSVSLISRCYIDLLIANDNDNPTRMSNVTIRSNDIRAPRNRDNRLGIAVRIMGVVLFSNYLSPMSAVSFSRQHFPAHSLEFSDFSRCFAARGDVETVQVQADLRRHIRSSVRIPPSFPLIVPPPDDLAGRNPDDGAAPSRSSAFFRSRKRSRHSETRDGFSPR